VLVLVLSGELVRCYDGGEIAVAAGDTMAVHGGSHAWSNSTSSLAVLATVGVGDPAQGTSAAT
jgi:uncharacterized cupin superfamily protein